MHHVDAGNCVIGLLACCQNFPPLWTCCHLPQCPHCPCVYYVCHALSFPVLCHLMCLVETVHFLSLSFFCPSSVNTCVFFVCMCVCISHGVFMSVFVSHSVSVRLYLLCSCACSSVLMYSLCSYFVLCGFCFIFSFIISVFTWTSLSFASVFCCLHSGFSDFSLSLKLTFCYVFLSASGSAVGPHHFANLNNFDHKFPAL